MADSSLNKAEQAEKATSVLGRGVLLEVHKDMASTQLPTWLQPAPVSFGSTAGGKLSADEWRVVSTVHLTITMIRLWGGLNPDDRKKKMLAAVPVGQCGKPFERSHAGGESLSCHHVIKKKKTK